MTPVNAPRQPEPPDDEPDQAPRARRPRLSARLLFGAIGAVACLLAALALEGFYWRAHTASWLSHDDTPILLFLPHIRNDTERRLREANATSGDIEISLTWDNLNDLDLHCIDPEGQHIFYVTTPETQPAHATNGVLDIDRNRGVPYTNHPVEHIYFQHGHTPPGRYQVFVDHYALHGGSDPTKYQVTVKEFGRIHKYDGQISRGYQHPARTPGKLICEFTTGSTPFPSLGLPAGFWRGLLVMAVWTAIVSMALSAALLAGLSLFYRSVYRTPFLEPGKAARIGLTCLLLGGLSGAIAQAAYTFVTPPFLKLHPTWSHIAGVALLAVMVGMALGGRIPHLKRGRTFLGGLAGGALSGRLFMGLYLLLGESVGSEICARVVSAAVIGAAIGFTIELIVEPPQAPEEPIEYEDEALDGMQPLSLRANRIGPTGKLRRAGREPAHR